MFKVILLSLILGLSIKTYSQVDPPNYNFSLDKFDAFMPGSKLSEVQKTYGKGEAVFKKDPYTTYRFFIEHIRYKFVILVQTKEDEIIDFHANLPTYFLHDIFHQSLINRLGKQSKYARENEQAVYVWNKEKLIHTYSGACSITCFPIYYAVEKKRASESVVGEYKSILQQLMN